MARLIQAVGPCRFEHRTEHSHFYHITRSIVFQQLSTLAARTIHGRFIALFDSLSPEPHAVARMDDDVLRGAGLSRQKASYIKDLATRVHAGELPLERIETMTDEEIIEALTAVKGIGVWSAQMFLMFRLGRPNVLPVGDLGIQKAVQKAYKLRKLPAPKKVQAIGRPWAPYSTIASWYLWRSLEL